MVVAPGVVEVVVAGAEVVVEGAVVEVATLVVVETAGAAIVVDPGVEPPEPPEPSASGSPPSVLWLAGPAGPGSTTDPLVADPLVADPVSPDEPDAAGDEPIPVAFATVKPRGRGPSPPSWMMPEVLNDPTDAPTVCEGRVPTWIAPRAPAPSTIVAATATRPAPTATWVIPPTPLANGNEPSQLNGPPATRNRPTDTCRKARTTWGSKWLPAQVANSARAAAGLLGLL